MISFEKFPTAAIRILCGGMLVVSLCAAPAFADPTPSDLSSTNDSTAAAPSYEGNRYTVTVYGGNQGTVNGEDSVALGPVALGETVDFSELTVEVPSGSKYYAKGVRLAGLDNVRSDKNRNGQTTAGEMTVMAATVQTDGRLAGTATITEDTDFVVAYGILANRVAYTVTYTDADGNELAPARTFFGDIGDVPATAPVYIEGYLPDASLLTKTLVEDESQNVFPFVYARLAPEFQTEENPETGDVTVTTPGGATTAPVYNTTPATAPTTPAATTAPAGAGTAEGAVAEGTTVATTPLTTDDGTEVVADDGTPLNAPQEESLDDDETALASGAEQPGNEAAADSNAWLPWAVAAVALAAVIAFILVRASRKSKEEEAEQPVE